MPDIGYTSWTTSRAEAVLVTLSPALTEALKTPGHAVAFYPMRGLVAEDGVLDKLRARGITVRTPGDG